jgi:hypothetical protein
MREGKHEDHLQKQPANAMLQRRGSPSPSETAGVGKPSLKKRGRNRIDLGVLREGNRQV